LLNVIILSVAFSYCDANCHFAECHYAECRYAEYSHAECRYAECNYTEYLGAVKTLSPMTLSVTNF
jgi:hypothetical protein